MRRPPSLLRFLHFPVTGGICLLAVVISFSNWYGHVNIAPIEMNYWAWHGQPWRLLSCALFHVNPIHLLFDVYWTWVFGAIVEEELGSLAMLLLFGVLQCGSAAAEYAVSTGAVGLSGVGYGLFGFLWVSGRYNRRFAGVMDRNTAWMFVGWFFLCIVLTITNIAPIANVAHAAGALLGGIAGLMAAFRGPRSYASGAALGATLALFLACSSPTVRPLVNYSKFGGYEEFELGYNALKAGHGVEAVYLLRQAVAYRHADPVYWLDLGVAYREVGNNAMALAAFRHASAMQPDSKEYHDAVRSLEGS